MEEVGQFNRKELDFVKAAMQKSFVKVRKPYGKTEVFAERTASFFASTNRRELLTDETGSVRWLVFEVTAPLDWKKYIKKINIDKVWAQAADLLKKKYAYQLTTKEIQENEKANAQYQATGPEHSFLAEYFEPAENTPTADFMTSTQIVEHITKESGTKQRLKIVPMGKALKQFGFIQRSKRINNFPQKGWLVRKISEETNHENTPLNKGNNLITDVFEAAKKLGPGTYNLRGFYDDLLKKGLFSEIDYSFDAFINSCLLSVYWFAKGDGWLIETDPKSNTLSVNLGK